MPGEVYNRKEGVLSWVAASASASANAAGVSFPKWGTAATPTSGIFGFVRDFSFTSGRTINTVSDRGTPSHHKKVSEQPIDVNVTFAWTGLHPTAVAANGQTVEAFHLEFRQLNAINGSAYYQFINCVDVSEAFTEADEENTMQMTFRALAVVGVTGSGYIR